MTELQTIRAETMPQRVTFTTDELTALCPFDFGGPDFYTLTLRYEPGEYGVESKSLKQYLESFRETEATAETLANEIYETIVETISPERCYLRLEQARRGGIEETVEMGDYELGE
jgi:7-cyano-7-deazaguanine reductase